MKQIVAVALVAVALAGCITPYKTGDERVYSWSQSDLDKQFPLGTTKSQIFTKLGKPYRKSTVNGLSRWEYTGETKGSVGFGFFWTDVHDKRTVAFVFDESDQLVDKVYEGF